MVSILSRNAVFVLYSFSLIWLATISAVFEVAEGGSRSLPVAIVALWLIASLVYFGIRRLLQIGQYDRAMTSELPKLGSGTRWLLASLVVLYACIVIVHIGILGYVPVLETFRQKDDISISIIRQSAYFSLPGWMRYASDYGVKALGPALLAIAFYYHSKIYWAVLAIGCFYCIALFARVLPIYFLLPVLFLAIYRRAWRDVAFNAGILVLLLALLTAISATTIRQNLAFLADIFPAHNFDRSLFQSEVDAPDDWESTSVIYALYDRVAIVPARVMDQWFSAYSDVSSREDGCGYRLGAKILGCEYVHIPSKLYERYYPENVAQGMKGSLNAASFMTDYANFGAFGFLWAGVAAGILYAFIAFIYGEHPLSVPFNLSVIIAMMETNIFTAINSGSGWIVFTVIFILFFRLRKA